MTTASLQYKAAGLQRILAYKESFEPGAAKDPVAVNRFINLFCEYQLADNNYRDIQFEAANQKNETWFTTLSLDQVLQYITYIIWTDKFMTGYLDSCINDRTMFQLLSRMQALETQSSTGSENGEKNQE